MVVKRILGFSAAAVCLAVGTALAADVAVIEQIIAKVNGDIITRGELERQRAVFEAELRQQQGMTPVKAQQILKDRERDVLRDQIDQLLLVQKGKELNISCAPETTRQLAEIQKQSGIADPDKFQQYLREQSGMPFEDFKLQITNSCLTQRVVRQEVGGRMSVPKEELQKYYEENKAKFVRKEEVFLREIFLSTEGKNPAQLAAVEKKAKDLVARARKGEKFPELARDNSESDTGKQYGELGWWKKGDLNPQIEGIVFKEKRNYVSDPIKTDRGFLILKIEERHEAGQAAFEDVENEIMEAVYYPKMQPKVREFLTRLREEAFLEIRAGFIDSGAAPGKDTAWKDPAQLKPETTTKEEVLKQGKRRRLLGVIPAGRKRSPAAEIDTSTLGARKEPAAAPPAPATPAPPK